MKKLITVIMLLVSTVCYASTNYDITGTWKGYLNSDAGYAKVTMEIEQYEDPFKLRHVAEVFTCRT